MITYLCFQLFVLSTLAAPLQDSVVLLIHNQVVQSTFMQTQHANVISMAITHDNTTFTLDLLLNTKLMSSDYHEKIMTETGNYNRTVNHGLEFCHYVGSVRDESDSSAAFTTCPLISGIFRVGELMWRVEESQEGVFQVILERKHNIADWYRLAPMFREQMHRKTENSGSRRKRSIQTGYFEDKLVIELYVATDKAFYAQNSLNENIVVSKIKTMVNTANLLYQPVGMEVVLVGLEVWTSSDLINITVDSSRTLEEWYRYRFEEITTYNDIGFLISAKSFLRDVLGLAQLQSICSSSGSGGLMTFREGRGDIAAVVLTHEMGHNLGLQHDSGDCNCLSTDTSCIMSASASFIKPASIHFSSCSKEKLSKLGPIGLDICLQNTPHTLNFHMPVCGNGILEDGEECDCGRLPQNLCNSEFCSASCLLIGECAQGLCCEVSVGRLKSQGQICRKAISDCDLAEVCDGRLASCPNDINIHDGSACTTFNEAAYCYDGVCQSRTSQCKLIFGTAFEDGISGCYVLNRVADLSGFCERTLQYNNFPNNQIACADEDKECGLLMCGGEPTKIVIGYPYIYKSFKNINFSSCNSVIFDVGTDTIDPSFAPNGSPCGGSNRMCLNRKCVETSYILGTNPCPECINGKCGNDGKCFCDLGFNGTFCNESSTMTTSFISTPVTENSKTTITHISEITSELPAVKMSTLSQTTTDLDLNGEASHLGINYFVFFMHILIIYSLLFLF